ncbi:hypothetical protein DXG03_007089 [Asterophora parasitica]|uniref:Cation efflux protein transmembrane domain-containing protein n=1 Tax=Asterophora parasitica TaxID=117018 RepID=A0A9P7GCL5_9AGAR|nr:hypothetical protein DXG03_007089 [Asterophora parasitica]
MAMSRSARITLLLIIDILFFFIELIVGKLMRILRKSPSETYSTTGYAVGSLALVADSFHMLNDVMSLIVALYAIKASPFISPRLMYSKSRDLVDFFLFRGLEVLLWVAQSRNPRGTCKRRVPSRAMLLHIPRGHTEVLQHSGYVLITHPLKIRLHLSIEISNAKLVVIVGSFGLASNIVGLFLFHGK